MAALAPSSQAEEERMLRAAMAASRQAAAQSQQQRQQGSELRALRAEQGFDRGAGGDGNVVCQPVCLLGGCLAVTVGLFMLILASMAVVDPTQYGLRFDRWSLKVEQEHFGPGRHWIGPLAHMIIYPATVQTIEFSTRSSRTDAALNTRTDEGLDLTVEIAFQYKLKPEALWDIYMNYRDDYRTVLTRQATSLLLQVASKYEAEKYWTERFAIGEAMLGGLQELFFERANITGVQLFVIQLPDTFEEKIVDTQVQRQIKQTRSAEQAATVTRAKIQVMLAGYNRDSTIVANNASATAYYMRRESTAFAEQKRIDIEQRAIAGVQSKIGLTAAGLVEYQRGISYQSLDSAQFMFGVPQAAAIVDVGGR